MVDRVRFAGQLRKRSEDCVPKQDPLATPDYVEADCQALRSLARGDATDEQQKRALRFIIEDVCGTYDTPVRKTDRETYVAAGKQRVGQMLVWFLNVAPTKTPLDKIAARVSSQKPGD